MNELTQLTRLLATAKSEAELRLVLQDLLTDSEVTALLQRLRSVALLLEGETHRSVQQKLGISISKVTHAANHLKKGGKGFRLLFPSRKKGH